MNEPGSMTSAGVPGGVLHRRGRRPLRSRHARQPRPRRRDWRSRTRSTSDRRRRRRAVRGRARTHRLRRSAAVPGGSRAPHVLRGTAHRAGADTRGRGCDDRRGRGGPGDLLDRERHRSASRRMPGRHRCACAAIASYCRRRRSPPSCATSTRHLGDRTRSPRSGGSTCYPNLVNVVAGSGVVLTVDLRNTDDR
jgi:hypothetical protein